MGFSTFWGFYDPPVLMSSSQDVKINAPVSPASSFEVSDNTLGHEIVRVGVNYSGPPLGSNRLIRFQWVHLPSGDIVLDYDDQVPVGWDSWWWKVWIGHLVDAEIYRSGDYECRLWIAGSHVHSYPFTITGLEPPGPHPSYGRLWGETTVWPSGPIIPHCHITFGSYETDSDANGNYELLVYEDLSATMITWASGWKPLRHPVSLSLGEDIYYNARLDPMIPSVIHGHVKDSVSDAAVPFALVVFRDWNTHTNLNGDFSFSVPDPVSGSLVVSQTGYDSYSVYVDCSVPGSDIIKNVSLVPVGVPPPPPPPPVGVIHGQITDSESNNPILGINVSFADYGTFSDLSGNYNIEVSAGVSAIFRAEHPDYEPFTEWISCGPGDDITRNVSMVHVGEPPTPGIIQQFLDLIATSVTAAYNFFVLLSNSVKNLVLTGIVQLPNVDELLQSFGMCSWGKFVEEHPEYDSLTGSPQGSLSIAAILGIVGAILGFGTLINWARKEFPEPAGMTVWAMIEAGNWEGANTANAKYIGFIKKSNAWYADILGWMNPFVKSYFDLNEKAQLAAAAGYQTLINSHLQTNYALLTINSNPDEAKIYVNDDYLFETTNTTLSVPSGTVNLVLKKVGYIDWSQSISLAPGATETINAELVPTGEPPPPSCSQHTTESACIGAGCYWYNNSCHSAPGVPSEEIIIPLEPASGEWNAWKVTIKSVDAVTGEALNAAILINDQYMDKYTPYYFYFAELATYNIKLRKQGYIQGEVTFTTEALPPK